MSYLKIYHSYSNFRFGFIEILRPPVAAVLTAECHANIENPRIRRLKPPLQEVAKPKAETCVIHSLSFIIHY
jgi:hypothetical protein